METATVSERPAPEPAGAPQLPFLTKEQRFILASSFAKDRSAPIVCPACQRMGVIIGINAKLTRSTSTEEYGVFHRLEGETSQRCLLTFHEESKGPQMTYIQIVIYRNTENETVYEVRNKTEATDEEKFNYATEPEVRRKVLELIDIGTKSLP